MGYKNRSKSTHGMDASTNALLFCATTKKPTDIRSKIGALGRTSPAVFIMTSFSRRRLSENRRHLAPIELLRQA
jgi:hypothetical protein